MNTITKKKPIVCLVDEDAVVHQGWAKHFGASVMLLNFSSFKEFLEDLEQNLQNFEEISCIVTGRYFQNEDIAIPNVIKKVKTTLKVPIFLNWQGFIQKEEEALFDGRLFYRYGLRWNSLKNRVQKILDKNAEQSIPPSSATTDPSSTSSSSSVENDLETKKSLEKSENVEHLEKKEKLELKETKKTKEKKSTKSTTTTEKKQVQANPIAPEKSEKSKAPIEKTIEKPKKCENLLLIMAKNAQGPHKEKIQELAHDPKSGMALLEAIYDRLVRDKNAPPSCPSRYIHSSPVIAKRMLHEALYQ